MKEERNKYCTAGAARLRALRRSLGYKTAASFARALGYHPDRYRRYERIFFCNGGPLAQFVHALKDAGFDWIDLNWLLVGTPSNIGGPGTTQDRKKEEVLAVFRAMPTWAQPAFMRLGVRLNNGVDPAKAEHLFRQEPGGRDPGDNEQTSAGPEDPLPRGRLEPAPDPGQSDGQAGRRPLPGPRGVGRGPPGLDRRPP